MLVNQYACPVPLVRTQLMLEIIKRNYKMSECFGLLKYNKAGLVKKVSIQKISKTISYI